MSAKKTAAAVAAGLAAVTGAIYLSLPGPSVPQFHITWKCNYTEPNEETVIVSTTNLAKPLTNWIIRFTGATNCCTLPRTNPCEFFRAYNRLP